MKIGIAQFTIATANVKGVKIFFSGILGSNVAVADHEFFYTLQDKRDGGCLAVVPHNGDKKWDIPWLSLATDDFPAALRHIRELGVSDIENSGPTDEEGNPTACVTFRDPEGRLVMLFAED